MEEAQLVNSTGCKGFKEEHVATRCAVHSARFLHVAEQSHHSAQQ
jgi:hypothetical protein